MGKRVGMTQDIQQRQADWRREYPSLHNWIVRATHLTYEQAQKMEEDYIRQGYEGSPGGPYAPGNVWSVYTFEY